ncbi:MAG: LysM peptidoglycan-binding domain-containing protein [Anaerolineae bacterium]|nr:LysM peptidoglycan-binding domain-containing protein [Anaerolineae bacterium]
MKNLKLQEIIEKLPAYWWGWSALTVAFIGAAAWVQVNVGQPTPPPPVSIILPSPPPPTPTPAATPLPAIIEPLANFVEVAILKMTPLPQTTATPTLRPTVTPTPIFVFHPVKAGETLISIASKYGITSEALLAANNIRDPANLEVGQDLLIPPKDGLRVPVVPHTVAAGDTLLSIAAKYGSSVKKILAANPQLKADDLPVGKSIAVPVVFTEDKPIVPPEEAGEPVYYTIVEGDTPLAIAQEYDVPVELLLAANEITDPTLLQIGQQLLIPPTEGLTQGVPIILYELEEGDTLLGLALEFGSSVKDILAVNPELIPSSLEVGQTVAIPVIFAPPRPTPAPQRPRATPVPIAPPPSLVEMEQQMIAGVNTQREAAGLPPYQVDEEIAQMALDHAQDMVVRGYFGHVTPEGNTLRDRFAKLGISSALNVGEDIQRNTRPAGETVQFALNWFMNSRPHRANILHPHHNRIGVGIVEGPPGWYTYVLVFAER